MMDKAKSTVLVLQLWKTESSCSLTQRPAACSGCCLVDRMPSYPVKCHNYKVEDLVCLWEADIKTWHLTLMSRFVTLLMNSLVVRGELVYFFAQEKNTSLWKMRSRNGTFNPKLYQTTSLIPLGAICCTQNRNIHTNGWAIMWKEMD